MLRRSVTILGLVVFVLGLSGCATGRRQKDLEMQGLRNQISALQAQLQAKDDEVSSLRESLSKLEEQQREVTAKVVSKKKVIGEVKERPTAKQIQIALKNAGYDPGAIDGKIGRQTRDAIESFQKANNLHTDGKVGKKTWALLRDYLYKQVK